MSMEKMDMVPESEEEIQEFYEIFLNRHDEVVEMLKRGKARIVAVRNEKGFGNGYKILAENGELLYYENLGIRDNLYWKKIN